jgi:GDPmannose 4,6-dehydratase
MSRTALIFGISGQTGSYLAHRLLAQGYRVFGTSRDSQLNNFTNLKRLGIYEHIGFRSVSLSDFRSVLMILGEIAPDEIYNLAGQSSVALSFEHPAETVESVALGTLNILECLRFYGGPARFFNAASTDCFGHTEGRANETSAFRPRSPYGVAKAASFWTTVSYRQSYGIHCCNGILSNHESPLRPSRFVTRKIALTALRIAKGSAERLSVSDLSIARDWGWAPDYADAIARILQADAADDYVVGTGRTCTLETLIEASFDFFGLRWQDHVDVDPQLSRPADIPSVTLDPGKIARVLGWQPTLVMPDLMTAMLRAELDHHLGAAPWSEGPLRDHGAQATPT